MTYDRRKPIHLFRTATGRWARHSGRFNLPPEDRKIVYSEKAFLKLMRGLKGIDTNDYR